MSASHRRRTVGRLVFCLLLGLLPLAVGHAARAGLTVDTLVLDMADPKAPRRDLTLANDGQERLYVEVTAVELLAGPDGRRQERQGPPDQLGLLVTPNRLILEPGQRRQVRVVVLGRASETERIYRITLKPVVGEVLVEQPTPGARGTSIKVLLGYQALVLVRPAVLHEQLLADRQGRRLRFENAGNVSLRLEGGRQCATPTTPAPDCERLPGRWLRPGAVWELPLGHDTPVRYILAGPSGSEQKSY